MDLLKQIQRRVEEAARGVGRDPKEICLIGVSKGQPLTKIAEAYALGQRDFGENYAQEFLEKVESLPQTQSIRWHFLGHLQKNKVKKIIEKIDWLHSLDSFPLAEQIQRTRTTPLPCLLEIKCSEEETKTGLEPKQVFDLISKLKNLDRIDLRGLMTIPPLTAKNPRIYFQKLHQLLQEINKRGLYSKPLGQLSMGMSGDFEIAIEEGSTMVRIGTALFGERKKT